MTERNNLGGRKDRESFEAGAGNMSDHVIFIGNKPFNRA